MFLKVEENSREYKNFGSSLEFEDVKCVVSMETEEFPLKVKAFY